MVSWGRGHPSSLSRWRREFESRWDRKVILKYIVSVVRRNWYTAARKTIIVRLWVGVCGRFKDRLVRKRVQFPREVERLLKCNAVNGGSNPLNRNIFLDQWRSGSAADC